METAIVHQAPQSIFLNSKFANTSSSSSNQLNFSFKRALTKEQGDLCYIALANFTTFNTFPSISQNQGNNVCKIMNIMYNAVTKTYDYSRVKRLVIPDDRYDINSLSLYLNTYGNYQELVALDGTGAVWTSDPTGTNAYLYLGFGFNGLNNVNTTTPILGFIPGTESGKLALQPALTLNTSAYNKIYTSGSLANDQYAYAGVFLIIDNETEGFMESIGFSSKFTPAPLISNNYKGYGIVMPVNAPPSYQGVCNAPLVVALQGPWLLYMSIDSLANNSKCNDMTLDQLNIVASIPINNYYGACIDYTLSFDQYQLLEDLNASSFSVTFYDENRKIVDFRGGQWCACLHIITKSNAKDDLTNRISSNTVTSFSPAVYQPRTVTNQLKRPNPYGGSSSLGRLN